MDKYAVFGHPIKHSLSPKIHELFAAQTKQKIEYSAIEPPPDKFEEAIKKFITDGGKGCNISFPFKHRAFLLADETSNTAKIAQAASGLLIRDNHTIYGDNYDGTGLVQDLSHNYHYSFRQKKILILGAGGAVQGILGPLLDTAPAEITIVNRDKQKGVDLAKIFQSRGFIRGIGFDEIEPTPVDLIIHATTVGYDGHVLPLPNELVSEHTWCYDLSYGPAAQPFLNWAKNQGASASHDGLGMLVEHNAALFYLWCNIYPDTQPVIHALKQKIQIL